MGKDNARFTSFLIALFINAKIINAGLDIIFKFSFLQYIYIMIGVFSFLVVVFNINKLIFATSTVGMAAVLMGYYFLSYGTTSVAPVYFISYVILPVALSLLDFDSEKVIRYVACMTVPLIFISGSVFELHEVGVHDNITMGMTYAFLPSICAAFVHYKYFKNNCSKRMYIAYWINIFYLVQILKYGSRGPILAIALLIVAMFIYNYDNTGGKMRINPIVAFFIITLTILVILYYDVILRWIQIIFASYNIKFNFINKILRLAERNNIMNGRLGLFRITLQMFLQAPIIGHGISSFSHYTLMVYPHNSILQLMFDGGIVLTVIVLCMVISRTRKNMQKSDVYGFAFFLFLFFVSVPGSMVSGDLFENSSLWLWVFMLMNNKFISRDNNVLLQEMVNPPYSL